MEIRPATITRRRASLYLSGPSTYVYTFDNLLLTYVFVGGGGFGLDVDISLGGGADKKKKKKKKKKKSSSGSDKGDNCFLICFNSRCF